jgi:hypothetical protein
MFYVVLKEVPFHTDVFSLLVDQGILGVRDGALIVLPNGSCSGDGGVEDFPHKSAAVESLLGGVCRKVIFSLTSGLGDTKYVAWACR